MSQLKLTGASNTELVKADERLTGRVSRIKERAAETAADTMGLLLAGIGAAGAGAYVGHRSAQLEMDATLTEEEKQEAAKIFGVVEPDLLAGVGLAIASMVGVGGKRMSKGMLDASTGILGYYAGSRGFKMAKTAED